MSLHETKSSPTANSGQHRVHRFATSDYTVRAAAVNATEVVREMQNLQNTYPLPTVAVGRAMVGAILMASHLKEQHQVGLYVRGSGPLKSIYAEAHFEGQVRGYTPHTFFEPASYGSSLSLAEVVGRGTLTVTQHVPFEKQPFQGVVELVNGEIGDDIAAYLHQSQQIRSVVALGVALDTYGKVISAGGVLIEVMPGVAEATVDLIQKNVDELKTTISQAMAKGAQPQDLIAPYLKGLKFEEIQHHHPVVYACPCDRDRVARALETFGIEELQDMIDKNEAADTTCQMCGRPYRITPAELSEIKDRLYRNSLN